MCLTNIYQVFAQHYFKHKGKLSPILSDILNNHIERENAVEHKCIWVI